MYDVVKVEKFMDLVRVIRLEILKTQPDVYNGALNITCGNIPFDGSLIMVTERGYPKSLLTPFGRYNINRGGMLRNALKVNKLESEIGLVVKPLHSEPTTENNHTEFYQVVRYKSKTFTVVGDENSLMEKSEEQITSTAFIGEGNLNVVVEDTHVEEFKKHLVYLRDGGYEVYLNAMKMLDEITLKEESIDDLVNIITDINNEVKSLYIEDVKMGRYHREIGMSEGEFGGETKPLEGVKVIPNQNIDKEALEDVVDFVDNLLKEEDKELIILDSVNYPDFFNIEGYTSTKYKYGIMSTKGEIDDGAVSDESFPDEFSAGLALSYVLYKPFLTDLIENKVFFIKAYMYFSKLYAGTDKEHGMRHVEEVLDLALKMNNKLKLNIKEELIVTAALGHDAFSHVDRDNHHELGAKHIVQMYGQTHPLFNTETIDFGEALLIGSAIGEHRASYKGNYTSPLSLLISAADRGAPNIWKVIKRIANCKADPANVYYDPEANVALETYKHLIEKYSRNGYAKYTQYYKDYFEDELDHFWDVIDGLGVEDIELYLTQDEQLKNRPGRVMLDTNIQDIFKYNITKAKNSEDSDESF